MNDRLDRLERLARLHAEGLLSTSEFEHEKKRLLDDEGTRPAASTVRPALAIVAVIVGLLVLGLAGWLGPQLVSTPSKPGSVWGAKARRSPPPQAPTLAKAAEPSTLSPPAPVAKSAPAAITLRAVRDADSEQLDMGCMCAFNRGDEALLQISANTAVLRPQGRLMISRISDATFERMYGDRGQFTAGGYTVRVRPRGSSRPGFDGHSTTATLTVSRGQERTEISGQWLCGC